MPAGVPGRAVTLLFPTRPPPHEQKPISISNNPTMDRKDFFFRSRLRPSFRPLLLNKRRPVSGSIKARLKFGTNGLAGWLKNAVGAVVVVIIVTVSVALSGLGVEGGAKEHELDCGVPVQENEMEPLNVPSTGSTLKAN